MQARKKNPASDLLPPVLEKLVNGIGFPATLKVVERWGGTRLYVPKAENIGEEHELAKAIGIAAAHKLARAHAADEKADDWLEVPRAAVYLRRVRDQIIRESYQGTSVTRLARKFGMTRRNVFYIVSRDEPAEDIQADLFR